MNDKLLQKYPDFQAEERNYEMRIPNIPDYIAIEWGEC